MAATIFCNVFIVKTVGKGHGLMLRTLFLIGVCHISNEREGLNKGKHIICWGGYHDKITYGGVVAVLCWYLLEQCLEFNIVTSKKSYKRNFLRVFGPPMHVHHTIILKKVALPLGVVGKSYWEAMILGITKDKFCSLRANFKQDFFEQFQGKFNSI
jgi:hypothetical protein